MKKEIISWVLVVIMCFLCVACGDPKAIDGVEYQTYGFINKDDEKNPNIQYRIIYGNVVWSILLCETVVAPVYFFGFSLYEPVQKK